ncbi:DNA polymerase III subunit alpha [Bacillus sp. B1-b2]|uniref:DNA polymerase III subunit alpha n=1 Tax=Bacillus sp. B1-b2 TaxID=2653201 RepID=UPI001262165A|nr:DNA polymerase III subunit alpha [Bacillus sp. B1-b2]KAB7668003.1 DNA polymerase III subunit alpha [Bacillus sp. B1-b2]
MSFVHLQVASSYSLLSSTISIKDLVTNASKMGYKSLALTDRNVLFGAQAFYKEAVKNNIKPILGLTVDVISEWEKEKTYSLLLLARNNVGFSNLLKISSAVATNNQGGIPVKWLKAYSKGLIAISPGLEGEIEQYIIQENIEMATKVLQLWTSVFEQNQFFLSIQRHGLTMEDELNQHIVELGHSHEIKIVATNHVCYLQEEDHFAYECLRTIKQGEKLADVDQNEWTTNQQYFKSSDEMVELFSDIPLVLENAWYIGQECQVTMDEFQTSLPKYPVPYQEVSAEAFLRELCMEGLRKRYSNIEPKHVSRLEYELEIINKMGYSDYFLIVWDFMKYARENGILTGPGRGSAAGSIVAYVLFITEIDPINYHLLFERFLNPERISMPDIDIDFPDNKRDHVIQYVKAKYGEMHVAQIITFGTFAAKASLRDIGRVFGLSVKELDALTRTIPSKLGISLKDSYKESKELQQFVAESPKNKRIFETACKIEGLPRHTSTHAAGVVLSHKPLVNVIPILQGHEEIYLTQYSMEYLEELGLLKMDFLGLRNLSFLQNILDMISRSNHKKVDIKNLPLDDPKVYNLLSKGQTTGIFQLESEGMRKVLKSLNPTEFEDIVAVNALYRPGPMENIPHYIDRKHGKESINFYHPDLEEILKSTYGVIIYQEQIIQIASKMAGFSLGEADLLRRAVSKKQKDVLTKERVHFVNGAKLKGYAEQTANEIYELIVRFANYGFNRSHAVAYSMIAYQLAYLKANYPTYFMAALMSSATGNEGKLIHFINELKEMNVDVIPPSINKSHYHFQVEQGKIRYSLAAIKGIGGNVLKEILNARKHKKFEDIFDFCIRVSPKVINRKVLESLIYAGCFDEFGQDRATCLATIDVAIQHAQLVHPEEADQHDLFNEEDFFFKPKYVEVDPMKQEDKLTYEKSALGLYLSDHPVSIYKDFIKDLKTTFIIDMQHGQKYQSVLYVTDVNSIRTKKGEPMAFLHFSDSSGEMEGVVFPTVYKKGQSVLANGKIVYIEGKVEERFNKKQLVVQLVESMEQKVQALPKSTHKLFIKSRNEKEMESLKGDILRIIKKYPGSTPVIIHYEDTAKNIILNNEYKIFPNGKCLEELTKLLGANHVILSE